MKSKQFKIWISVLIVCSVAIALFKPSGTTGSSITVVPDVGLVGGIAPPESAPFVSSSDAIIQSAFDNRRSKIQIQGEGIVYLIFPDDLKGSRHQNFLLRLSTGLSLLIAHNIDLAPRIPNIRAGDTVQFYGVYEYNEKGGVVHWTHHDPAGRHIGGWLKHNGSTYQ